MPRQQCLASAVISTLSPCVNSWRVQAITHACCPSVYQVSWWLTGECSVYRGLKNVCSFEVCQMAEDKRERNIEQGYVIKFMHMQGCFPPCLPMCMHEFDRIKPGTHMRTKWFANYSRMVREPNACISGWDCKSVLNHLQMVHIPFTVNWNLLFFCANTRELVALGGARYSVFALGPWKINLPHA